MKRDEWLESVAVKRLALFANCANSRCRCDGFRPWIDGLPTNFEKQYGIFYFDLFNYDSYQLLERCRSCDHELREHTPYIVTMNKEDVEYYGLMVYEAFILNQMLNNEPTMDKTKIIADIYKTFIITLKKATGSSERLLLYAEPEDIPHTRPNVIEVLVSFIRALTENEDERRRLYRLSESFLSVFNQWEPPRPELFEYCSNRITPIAYQLFYSQWYLRIFLPKKLTLIQQYEMPEIYGVRTLQLFIKHHIAGKTEKQIKKDPILIMANLLHTHRESLTKVAEVGEIPKQEIINKIKFWKHADHHEKPKESPFFKPRRTLSGSETNEGIFSHEQMVSLLARIVELERSDIFATDRFGEDKFSADVAKAEIVKQEVEAGLVRFVFVKNDTSDPGAVSHADLGWLVQLKTLFNAQLPKMGADYIARLVFDHNHHNLALIRNCRVIGGCCFRPFPERRFIEIVFLAVSSHDQIKGYGTIVMNYMKDYAVRRGMMVLLTFADSYATGYFKKQGFTSEIGYSNLLYQGFIKEYEGATLMACQLHPDVRYITFASYIKACRDMNVAIHSAMNPLRTKTYYGIPNNVINKTLNKGKRIPLKEIPGMEKSQEAKVERESKDAQIPDLVYRMKRVLYKLRENDNAWPFLNPVTEEEVPEYRDYVKYPSDFETMDKRIQSGYYIHQRLFLADLCRIFSNCYSFNANDTEYYRCAFELNKAACKLIDEYFPGQDVYPVLPEDHLLPVVRELRIDDDK